MINYSINTEIRQKIIIPLVVASTVTIAIITQLVQTLNYTVSIPSSFALFGFYYWLFDNYLWRIPLIRKFHHIPDLSGDWEGEVTKPADPDFIDYPVKAIIEQTWTKIQIEVVGKSTRSGVISVSMDISTPGRRCIDYIYWVKPTLEHNSENKRGEGCQSLLLDHDNLLSGYYFSSKLRKGKLTLRRKV